MFRKTKLQLHPARHGWMFIWANPERLYQQKINCFVHSFLRIQNSVKRVNGSCVSVYFCPWNGINVIVITVFCEITFAPIYGSEHALQMVCFFLWKYEYLTIKSWANSVSANSVNLHKIITWRMGWLRGQGGCWGAESYRRSEERAAWSGQALR